MDYLEWNNLFVKHFFNRLMIGREVLLYVNEEVIEAVGEPFGAKISDFIESVTKGPEWAKGSRLCQKAYEAYANWRTRNLEYPPYVSYLVFFVLAAVTETDRAPQSYYPRLWKLLGEHEDTGTPAGFDIMFELWDDLEKWSREDRHEELGRFVARIRGDQINVGLPRSQTILSENERKALPAIFEAAGLDPTDPSSPEIIPKILSHFGQPFLEKRTRNLLESMKKEDSVLKNALVELTLDELEEWDGTVQEQETQEGISRQHTHTSLRLCIKLDSLASRARIYVRFKTGRLFPEEPFNFRRKNSDHLWNCIESRQGWSTPLKDINADPPETLDGALLNWSGGELLIDSRVNWRAGLPPADTRLFRLGTDCLPDWIETRRLERRMEFLLVCKSRLAEKIREWGKDACEIFEEKSATGLPSDWLLFYGKNAAQSCPGIGVITLSTTVRLQLKDGIKVGKGNAYFKFAAPKIVLENSDGSETVMMDSKKLEQPDSNFPVFILPEDAPSSLPIRIEVNLGDHRLSKVIRLEEFDLPGSFDKTPFRDSAGNISSEELSVYACGAHACGDLNETPYQSPSITCLSDKIVFIGERPGEISFWPDEPYPPAWPPVWAITKLNRKQWEVNFCGKPDQLKRIKSLPSPSGDKSAIKLWKEAVWHKRKRYILPEIKELQQIWNDYMRLGKNVK